MCQALRPVNPPHKKTLRFSEPFPHGFQRHECKCICVRTFPSCCVKNSFLNFKSERNSRKIHFRLYTIIPETASDSALDSDPESDTDADAGALVSTCGDVDDMLRPALGNRMTLFSMST